MLNIIFYVSGSIFIAQILLKFVPVLKDKNVLIIALYCFMGLFAINILNKIVNFLSAKVFRLDELRKEYNQNINFFNQSVGLILFPVTVLITYSGLSQIAVYIGIISFFSSYILRIVRLMKINFVKQINIFYMFLYLCTFEIIPILYLIKALYVM
jgi:hypothetical protein